MAEKSQKSSKTDKEFDSDQRFKYIGFDVQQGKIGEFFKSDSEKESWVKRVLKRRESKSILREKCTLTEQRVAGYEKIILTVASIVILVSLFMPWFSGYKEHEVEAKAKAPVTQAAPVADSTVIGETIDSLGLAASETAEVETSDAKVLVGEELAVADSGIVQGSSEIVGEEKADVIERDEAGFASITMAKKRKEIRKEFYSISAIGTVIQIGGIGSMVFSSGFILILTGLLIIIYLLLCIGLPIYTLYLLYGIKGDEDSKALALKKGLKWSWIPIAIWAFGFTISFFGASYSFDTSDIIKQIGSSYGVGTYLGLLSYGFYITIGGFLINAAKSIEI